MAKKKKDKEQKQEETLFVGLKEPENVQRNILEASREFLLILKKVETIKSIRKEKVKKIEEVNKQFRELRTLLNKLKKAMPTSAIKSRQHVISLIEEQKIREGKRNVSKKEIVSRKREPSTELQKLESEIAEIEGRLEGL
jgi:hypothetical protein